MQLMNLTASATGGALSRRIQTTGHYAAFPHGRRRGALVRALKSNASFDSEADLDKELADELVALLDPKRAERMKRHYELLWKVTSMRGAVEKCTCCQGSGERECDWCHGTGVLTVGDSIYVHSSSNHCPVCKAKGYVKCQFCRGTGSRAKWLGPIPDAPNQN